MSYSVRTFSPVDAPDLAESWTHLSVAGTSDPLFTSWEWLTTWWDIFGGPSRAEWMGLAAYDSRGHLAAVCPLFTRFDRIRGLLPVRRLEYVGGFWRGPPSVLTQQCDLIGDLSAHPGLVDALTDELDARTDWDELVIPAMPSNSRALEPLVRAARGRGWYVRLGRVPPSMLVRLDDGLDHFKMSLGSKTRRRVFHQRKTLESLGHVEHQPVEQREFAEALDLLNMFRRTRGASAVSDSAALFYRTLLRRLGEHMRPRLTYLTLDDQPISVNFALQIGERAYGIQLGFDPTVDSRLSLGMIHLGYAIEAAAGDGVTTYDLMGGEADGQGWKQHLANGRAPMVNLQLVRSKPLAWLYRLHELGRRR